MSSVVPLGLIAVVTACPTVKLGSNDKPGFKAWNDDPEAADGVICTPVGMKVPFLRSSSSALAEITAPILITLEIASASADTRTRDHRRTPRGLPVSFRSHKMRLQVVREFFRWLARQNHILYNPASDLELP